MEKGQQQSYVNIKQPDNFYPLIHPILIKTKNQILLYFSEYCKQPEKISTEKFSRKSQYFRI